MKVMPLLFRSPLATLVPLLLLVPAAAILSGCSGDTRADDDGPSVVATGPDQESDSTEPTDDPSTEPTDPSTEPTSTPRLPARVAAVCTPYSAMAAAVKEAASSSSSPDAVAAEIGPVMKEFAAQLPALQRPPGMSAVTWRGVLALGEHILELPDHPTNEQIEAVEDQLTEQQREAVDDAVDWLRANCAV